MDRAFSHFTQVFRLTHDHVKAKEIYKIAKSLKTNKEEGNAAFKAGNDVDPNSNFLAFFGGGGMGGHLGMGVVGGGHGEHGAHHFQLAETNTVAQSFSFQFGSDCVGPCGVCGYSAIDIELSKL